MMLLFKWNLSSSALRIVIYISLSFWRQFTFRMLSNIYIGHGYVPTGLTQKCCLYKFHIVIQQNNIFALWLPSWLSISSPCCHTRMKPPEFSCLQFPSRHKNQLSFWRLEKPWCSKTCSWPIVPTLDRHHRVARATEIRTSWKVSEVEKYLKL